jgi:hypothetical protein
MLTFNAVLPSGFPYFSKFSLTFGSVSVSYAFDININLAAAYGSGFLSG